MAVATARTCPLPAPLIRRLHLLHRPVQLAALLRRRPLVALNVQQLAIGPQPVPLQGLAQILRKKTAQLGFDPGTCCVQGITLGVVQGGAGLDVPTGVGREARKAALDGGGGARGLGVPG